MAYYNLNGTQSKIFYISELFYTAYTDRGAAPNVILNNVFDINIKNTNRSFDYVRIYSIVRTTVDGVPVVKRVTDIKLNDNITSYNYIDNNLGGSIEDISVLLYAGGDSIIPKTIEQKDNVLFLGNYEFKQKPIDSALKDSIKNNHQLSTPKSKTIVTTESTGAYPYTNQLKYSAEDITYSKYLEWYRLGVQFQDNTGTWSDAVWLGDYRQTNKPDMVNPLNSGNLNITVKDFTVNIFGDALSRLSENGWLKMRPLIVFPKPTEREIIAQGIVCPTVYNIEDRATNSPFAQSSWFARPNIPFDLSFTRYDDGMGNISTGRNIISNEYWLRAYNYGLPDYVVNNDTDVWDYQGPKRTNKTKYNGAKWPEFRHDCPIPDQRYENAEIQNIIDPENIFINSGQEINIDSNAFYVDQSILTFHSPEIEFDNSVKNIDLSNLKFRIVGSAPLTGTSTNVNILSDSLTMSDVLKPYYDRYEAAFESIFLWTDIVSSSQVFGDSGKYGVDININNIDINGFKGLLSMPFWLDRELSEGLQEGGNLDEYFYELFKHELYDYVVYPWNRDYALNNQTRVETNPKEGWLPIYAINTSVLDNKQMLNLRFSGYNEYLDVNNIWEENNVTHNGVSDIEIFNSSELEGIRLKAPKNSNLEDFVYYGNIDKIIKSEISVGYNVVYSNRGWGFPGTKEEAEENDFNFYINTDEWFFGDYKWSPMREITTNKKKHKLSDPIRIQYKSTPHAVVVLNYGSNNRQTILPTHYHVNSSIETNSSYFSFNNIPNLKNKAVNRSCFQDVGTKHFWEDDLSIYNKATTNFKVKYFGDTDPYTESLDNFTNSKYRWIKDRLTATDNWFNPDSGELKEYLGNGRWSASRTPSNGLFEYTDEYNVSKHFKNSGSNLWVQDDPVTQDALPVNHDFGYLWIGEIYNDNVQNRFGGTSESALFQNEWIVAGDAVDLGEQLVYSRGDTYIQRYDNLKTYAFAADAKNSVTDIVSFFCETHINIDGRYDRNRGNINNLVITPELFNLFNPAYTQIDNLFSYHVIDSTRYNLNIFSNSITWTKTKLFGEEIDNWTNINVVDNIDLDGEKGPLRTITKFNNELFAFQDEGLSNILFNSRTQIPSSEFSNIIMGNSGKVDGKYYIAQFGTNNRGSVKSTPNGIYFIDGITNGIYMFNGQEIRCLSDDLGFRDWVGDYVTNEEWNVADFKNFVTHYDETNSDVYFVSKEQCLHYSEYLNQFASFLSYEYTPHMFNLDGSFYSILNTFEGNSELFENFTGDYNMFYKNVIATETPVYEQFYTTIIANENPVLDKIFTNIDFKGDFFNETTGDYIPDATYDRVDVWTEYQNGTSSLVDNIDHKSTLKKKFNRWRANVPRDNNRQRERIRNNWAFIKLSKETPNIYRSELHEILSYYYL